MSSYEIKVKADGTPVSGINPRGTGWQIRLSEINLPTVDGVYFERGTFRPSEGVTLNGDRTEALVTITPKSNVGVTLLNKASLGSARITKSVIGDGARTGLEAFVVNAEIAFGDDAAGNELRQFTLKDGQHYDLSKLPIGAKVTFTEVQPTNTDLVTWSLPVISPKTLTIGTDASANTVSVTNEAKVTQGTFEVSKKLTGPEGVRHGRTGQLRRDCHLARYGRQPAEQDAVSSVRRHPGSVRREPAGRHRSHTDRAGSGKR